MDKAAENGRDSGGVQVISRAAAILRALGPEGMSLGELARATSLPRSTVQRIVDALDAESFVEVGERGVRPGRALQQLAQLGRSNIAARVRPHLENLFGRTHETINISTSRGREVVFLDRILSDQELRVVPMPGRPQSLHAMANGKAILSCLTDSQVRELMTGHMRRLTPATRVSMSHLLAELGEIRRTGYSYDRGEHASGVHGIGTPINVPGLPPHAVSIAAPAYRFEAELPRFQKALDICRRDMETELRGGV